MDNNVLEFILRVRDEASKTLEEAGAKVDDVAKKGSGFGKAFAIAGGVVAAGVGIAAVAMKDWADKASAAQVETVRYQQMLKNASDQMAVHTTVIKGNSGALTAQEKALNATITANQKQIAILKLSEGDHKAEIENLQKSTNALKLQALQLDNTAVVKDKVIKKMGESAPIYEELTKKAEELGKSYIRLGFDDETTATSFARLTLATKDTKKSQELLAVSADLARSKGIPLEQSTQAMIMAMQGSTKVLKQMGIELDDNATKEQVLAAIKAQTAGQAEQYSQTAQGANEALAVTMDNIKESLGDRLLPMITQIAIKFSEFLNSEKFNNFANAVGAGVDMVVQFITNLGNSIMPTIEALGKFFQPMIDGLMAFINENMPVFQATWTVLQAVINFGLGFIKGLWNTVWPSLLATFKGIWDMIVGAFKVAWGIFEVLINIGLGIVTGNWSKAWEGMKKGFTDIFNGLKSFVQGWWDSIVGFFRGGLNGIVGTLNGFINGINKASGGTVNIKTIPSFDNGGWVNQDGMAYVHAGEYVLSRNMLNGSQSIGAPVTNNNQPITIMANISNELDLNSLGYQLAWITRNSR